MRRPHVLAGLTALAAIILTSALRAADILTPAAPATPRINEGYCRHGPHHPRVDVHQQRRLLAREARRRLERHSAQRKIPRHESPRRRNPRHGLEDWHLLYALDHLLRRLRRRKLRQRR